MVEQELRQRPVGRVEGGGGRGEEEEEEERGEEEEGEKKREQRQSRRSRVRKRIGLGEFGFHSYGVDWTQSYSLFQEPRTEGGCLL